MSQRVKIHCKDEESYRDIKELLEAREALTGGSPEHFFLSAEKNKKGVREIANYAQSLGAKVVEEVRLASDIEFKPCRECDLLIARMPGRTVDNVELCPDCARNKRDIDDLKEIIRQIQKRNRDSLPTLDHCDKCGDMLPPEKKEIYCARCVRGLQDEISGLRTEVEEVQANLATAEDAQGAAIGANKKLADIIKKWGAEPTEGNGGLSCRPWGPLTAKEVAPVPSRFENGGPPPAQACPPSLEKRGMSKFERHCQRVDDLVDALQTCEVASATLAVVVQRLQAGKKKEEEARRLMGAKEYDEMLEANRSPYNGVSPEFMPDFTGVAEMRRVLVHERRRMKALQKFYGAIGPYDQGRLLDDPETLDGLNRLFGFDDSE